VVTRYLKFERRTGSVRRPKTGVPPTVLRNELGYYSTLEKYFYCCNIINVGNGLIKLGFTCLPTVDTNRLNAYLIKLQRLVRKVCILANSRSRSLYVVVRPSVCPCALFVHPTQAIEIFGNIFALLPEILDQSGRVGAKSPIFDLFSLVGLSRNTCVKTVGDKIVGHSLI